MPAHSFLRPALAAPLFALLLAGCEPAAPPEPPPLEGASIGAPFTLTREDGKPVRWSDFDGRYRIVYFGYTFCPDICPTDMQRTAQGLRLFDRQDPAAAKKIAVLFITLDPERDTPEVVREFTDAFDKRIVGVTGSPEAITATARDFGVYAAKGEATANGGYLVDHTNVTYLFDPEGKPLATLPTDLDGAAIAAELGKWVR